MAGIAWAHAFEQGNKRTAFEALWQFLRLNGYDLAISDSPDWAEHIIELVEHHLSDEEFIRLLRPFVVAVA
jgi:death-on-curing protein